MKNKNPTLLAGLMTSILFSLTTMATEAPSAQATPKEIVKPSEPAKGLEKKLEVKALETAPAEVPPPSASSSAVAAKPNAEEDPKAKSYDPTKFIGVAITDPSGKLQYVAENPSQTHSKEDYVMVRVKNIKIGKNEKGRVRIAVWNSSENYAQEGKQPFRASSHWAKDVQDKEMVFKIGGLEKGKSYSFFAHFDKKNLGYVKKFLGIPVDPFLFSNAKNQGAGPGLTREGLSPPKFENTLVKYNSPGQVIVMEF